MPKYRSSNYYAHPKKARPGSLRKPRAPPKKLEYEDDAEIVGVLPDDARLDLPTRTRAASPMKFKNGTNVFKFDFEAPVQLDFPHRPLGTGMSLEEMLKAIVDGDDKPAQATTTKTTTKTTTPRKRQREAGEESSDGHDGDDEKEAKQSAAARSGAKVTVAREAAGTKRRKLRV